MFYKIGPLLRESWGVNLGLFNKGVKRFLGSPIIALQHSLVFSTSSLLRPLFQALTCGFTFFINVSLIFRLNIKHETT
jgi:hypothetical protein